MLDHQIEFSKGIEEIYKPISGRMSDPNSIIPEGNPEGIKACEQYREIVDNLKKTISPELDLIKTRIIGPAEEMLTIINLIRKVAIKRSHKQLDLDRQLNSVKKIENKKTERTAKDEEKLYKYQSEYEIAKQEYEYFNNILKSDLPRLFELESKFIRPLFVSFYYMQLNVFYTLYGRIQDLKIGYFDMNEDIVGSFEGKRGDVQAQADAIPITHFKISHSKAKLDMVRNRHQQKLSETAAAPVEAPVEAPVKQAQMCTALYDFTAQSAGDLSFAAGTTIEILATDANGWWSGRVYGGNGAVGLFPGNYVRLI